MLSSNQHLSKHVITRSSDFASTGDGGEFQVPGSEEDVEAVLCNNKRFREVQSAHTAVSDMLAEDCSHLLRKAQAALAKAGAAGAGVGGAK